MDRKDPFGIRIRKEKGGILDSRKGIYTVLSPYGEVEEKNGKIEILRN